MKRRNFIKSLPAIIAGFFVVKEVKPIIFDTTFLRQLKADCESGKIKTILPHPSEAPTGIIIFMGKENMYKKVDGEWIRMNDYLRKDVKCLNPTHL